MTDNHTKCGIIYEKVPMRAGNDEQMINYERPYLTLFFPMFPFDPPENIRKPLAF